MKTSTIACITCGEAHMQQPRRNRTMERQLMLVNTALGTLRRCAGLRKAILLLLLTGGIALTSSVAQAANGSGLVKWVGVQHCCGAPAPYFIVKMTVRETSPCADSNQLFAALLNDQRGKAMYAMVLAAYLSGTPLTLTGKSTCGEVRNVFEDIELVLLDQ